MLTRRTFTLSSLLSPVAALFGIIKQPTTEGGDVDDFDPEIAGSIAKSFDDAPSSAIPLIDEPEYEHLRDQKKYFIFSGSSVIPIWSASYCPQMYATTDYCEANITVDKMYTDEVIEIAIKMQRALFRKFGGCSVNFSNDSKYAVSRGTFCVSVGFDRGNRPKS